MERDMMAANAASSHHMVMVNAQPVYVCEENMQRAVDAWFCNEYCLEEAEVSEIEYAAALRLHSPSAKQAAHSGSPCAAFTTHI